MLYKLWHIHWSRLCYQWSNSTFLNVTSSKLVLLVYQSMVATNIRKHNLFFILIILENLLSQAIHDSAKTRKTPPNFCYPCKRMPSLTTIATIFPRLIYLFISKTIICSHRRRSYFPLTSFLINWCMWILPTTIASTL